MLKLIIEDDEGRKTVVPFVRDEITIGRQEGNTIRLTERNVSRRHARLVRLNGHVVVEDLGSYNGTRLNGERIAGQSPLKEGDLIQIGDYDLALQSEGAANVAGPITTKVPSAFSPTSSNSAAMRKTEPAMEAMGEPEPEQDPEQEQGDYEAAPGAAPEEDGDEHDHTPPSSSAEQRRHSTSIIRLDQVEADRPRRLEDIPTEEAPRLLVLAPEEFRGQEFACIRTELRIGRTDDNDIALDHRSLSRTHVKLVREDSGEWRVIDMQSANGLTVNGESYAQATLGSGDIIELGHVKLRFLNAGDAADDLPASAGGSRSKLPLVAGLVALLLGAAAAVFFVLRAPDAPVPLPVDPVAVEDETPPPAPTEPVKQPSGGTQAGAVAPPAGDTPKDPPPETPAPQDPLAEAEQFIKERKLQLARSTLEPLTEAQGSVAEKARERLDVVNAELQVQKHLEDAERALNANKLEDAEAALGESKNTQLFRDRYAALTARLNAARPPPPAQPVVPTAGTTASERPTVQTPAPDEISDAEKAQKEGIKMLGAKRYPEAIAHLENCLKSEADRAECHLYLGSAYARTGKIDKGAEYYRRFLELAPTHAKASDVRKLLENYQPQQ